MSGTKTSHQPRLHHLGFFFFFLPFPARCLRCSCSNFDLQLIERVHQTSHCGFRVQLPFDASGNSHPRECFALPWLTQYLAFRVTFTMVGGHLKSSHFVSWCNIFRPENPPPPSLDKVWLDTLSIVLYWTIESEDRFTGWRGLELPNRLVWSWRVPPGASALFPEPITEKQENRSKSATRACRRDSRWSKLFSTVFNNRSCTFAHNLKHLQQLRRTAFLFFNCDVCLQSRICEVSRRRFFLSFCFLFDRKRVTAKPLPPPPYERCCV